MKKISKKSILSWLALLWVTLIIWFVNALLIDIDNSVDLPNVRFHSLFLWSSSLLYMSGDSKALRIWSWLMFWGLDVGIGWWSGNKIMNGVNPTKVIGWWEDNHSYEWVVVWWFHNEANNWVVVWWFENQATESTILGWLNNRTLLGNSLAFWSGALAYEYWFSWNSDISDESKMARIDAESGVLIWTYNPVTGVNLVVNWAVKIWWKKIEEGGVKGEIRAVSWCYYAFDGSNWHVINDWDITDCGEFGLDWACKFGNVLYSSGEVVIGYTEPYALECVKIAWQCIWWSIFSWSEILNIYPYCYELDGGWSSSPWSLEWDLNGDGEFNIADINYFFYKCYGMMMGILPYDAEAFDECDLNDDWEINIADVNVFVGYY